MISRHWRGLCRPEYAEAYIEYLRAETFPAIRRLPGFISASILRRSVDKGVEFLVITDWSSIEAIRGFAGADEEAAVVSPKVRDMMLEYDRVARYYEVMQ